MLYNNETNFTLPVNQAMGFETWEQILIAIPATILISLTIGGNVLVWTAVIIVKKLHQQPANLLILSLAASDLLVGFVMPLTLAYYLTGEWRLGKALCEVWTTLDVLLCTSSIMTLCAISIDRYFAITRPFKYSPRRTKKLMGIMIVGVWLLSAAIALAPQIGWKSEQAENQCEISQDIGYQIYATFGAFYLPSGIMIVLYGRIFLIAGRIAKSEARSRPSAANTPRGMLGDNTTIGAYQIASNGNPKCSIVSENNAPMLTTAPKLSLLPRRASHIKHTSQKEQKAIKTLGVIMGAFMACWLPFFIVAVIKPMCIVSGNENCSVPDVLYQVLTWVGYMNSFLNPIIYARFNRDFRVPFKMILSGKCTSINSKMRREYFTEHYGDDFNLHTQKSSVDANTNDILDSSKNRHKYSMKLS